MSAIAFFWLFLKAALFTTGGMGPMPILDHELIGHGFATEAQFAQALAVGQISPGPSGLWVISLGYLVRGYSGALLALTAILLPPILVLAIERLYGRVKDHPAVEGWMSGLVLAVVGIFIIIVLRLLPTAGSLPRGMLIAGIALALAASRRVPVAGIILLAAAAGVLLRLR